MSNNQIKIFIADEDVYKRQNTAMQAGADGLLIGTALWQAAEPAVAYRDFCELGDSFGGN